jgi:H+/gluconate symporter-like permease
MPFFGTTVFAGPGLGLVAGAVMLGFGLAWLMWRARRGRFAEETTAPAGVGMLPRRFREMAQGEGFDIAEARQGGEAPTDLPPLWLAALPIVAVVALNGLFAGLLLPMLDTAYLAADRWGGVGFDRLRGVWAIILALAVTILVIVLTNRRRLPDLTESLSAGAGASALPLLNTAVLVGFGTVIAALPVFAVVSEAVLGIAPGNPLVALAVSSSILSGLTGSASGGMSIALTTMGETFLARGVAAGIDPGVLHRVIVVATGGLDPLPHNGAVITLLPLLVVGLLARIFGKMNYLSLCGLLAGSMTDPPALAFANAMHPTSDAAALSYATVYPMVMFLRIISPQLLVILLWSGG